MSRRTDPKCVANTLKQANSKRPVEETSQCTRFALSGSRFCKNHQNLHQLTDEQLQNNTRICRGCKKHQYFVDMSYQICDACRDRGTSNREKKRDEKIIFPPCVICGFVGGNDRQFINYCNKHVTDGKKADIEAHGMKWCKGIIRGCPNPELSKDYPYERCEICRNKEREQETKRSEMKLQESVKYIESAQQVNKNLHKKIQIHIKQKQEETQKIFPQKIQIKVKPKLDEPIHEDQTITFPSNQTFVISDDILHTVEDSSHSKPIHDFDRIYLIDNILHKICSSPKHHCPHPLEEFFNDSGSLYYNQHKNMGDNLNDIISYMTNHKMIMRRCQTIRENQRIQDQKRYCTEQDSMLDEKRLEAKEYIEYDIEALRMYRKNHPEKCVRAYRGAIKSSNRKVCECRRSGKKREIPYELTIDQTKQLIVASCFYCGCPPQECKFHGIDRLDYTKNYTLENCVTSCSMCNYMKACHDPISFLGICEHILTYLKMVDGNLHPHLFANFNTGKTLSFFYEEYIRGADKRKYQWSLSIDEFTDIINRPCYLCGKLTTSEHINGIDRYDNTIGYIYSNSRPCCFNCNSMKKIFKYETFIDKLSQIHTNKDLILSKLAIQRT